jgi:hypothetical protein
MEDSEEWFLHLDCADLRVYDKPLYERLVRYPTEASGWGGMSGARCSAFRSFKI